MLDPVEFGKAMGSIVSSAIAPLQKRIEELEARQPERGDRGRMQRLTLRRLSPPSWRSCWNPTSSTR